MSGQSHLQSSGFVRLGAIDELVCQSLKPVGEGRELGGLDLPCLAGLPGAVQLQHPRRDGDEAGVFLTKAAKQRNLVLRDKRHAVEVVAELVDLAKRPGQSRIVWRRKRGGHAIELAQCIVLHLAVGVDLVLQPRQIASALLHFSQGEESGRAQGDEKQFDQQEGGEQLG